MEGIYTTVESINMYINMSGLCKLDIKDIHNDNNNEGRVYTGMWY